MKRIHAKAILFLALIALAAFQPLPTRADPVAESIDAGIVRFYPDASVRLKAEPSYALQRPFPAIGPVPAGFPVVPVFGQDTLGETATIAIPPNTSLYGTGLVFGRLLLNGQKHAGRSTVTWNTDAYGYGDSNDSLYESHPWVLALRPDGTAFGVLADTTYPLSIDTSDSGIQFSFAKEISTDPITSPYPIIVIDRKSPQDVVMALAKLTGYMPMPPKWAIGYQQSHYSYTPATMVVSVAKRFREERIPCDAIWMDIDYMDHFRVFTFNHATFPNPKKLTSALAAIGFHNVWIIDPAVRTEAHAGSTRVYDTGTSNDVWLKDPDGHIAYGNQWPSLDSDPAMRAPSVYPDFTSPSVRHWWASLIPAYMANGITGIWNDMDEPSVFATSKTMPLDVVHAGDPTLQNDAGIAQGAVGARGDHLRYHNVYGMLMALATREGMALAQPNKRPFVLTRANFIGGQRYAAVWSGDNTANWEHAALSIPMVLNMGLSGQPFVGPDLGGFRYDDQPLPPGTSITTTKQASGLGETLHREEAELYARWMGFGALFPFCRGHYEKGYPWDKEPYAYAYVDPAAAATCRLALQRRYRLIPYLYTLFHDAATTGLPINRPVFFADPSNPALRSADHSFLLGDGILVSADVTTTGGEPDPLPRGIWERFGFPTDDSIPHPNPLLGKEKEQDDTSDPDLPVLFLHGGSIVPSGPIMQYVDEKPLDTLTLLVCLDESGRASGTLYEDAGDGWDFTKGAYRLSYYSAKRNGSVVTIARDTVEGHFPAAHRTVVVRLLYHGAEYIGVGKDGSGICIHVK